MIITFFSFTLLGIWTGILALFNSRKSGVTFWEKPENKAEKQEVGPSVALEVHSPGYSKKVGGDFEFLRAFQDLWHEIVHGS